MKKISIIITFLLLPLHIHAQEVVFPQNISEIKQKIEYKKSVLSEKIQIKQQELQQKRATSTDGVIQILTQEKILKIVGHTFDKFEAVLVRFDGIIARLEVRISKLEENNIDVIASRELLEKAKISIEEAYVVILASKEEFSKENIVLNTDEIKQSFNEFKDILKNIQDILLLIIESLKDKDGLGDEGLLTE